jgi:hypothetical protein
LTLLEAIQKYEAINKRIRSAKIGLGANKLNVYPGNVVRNGKHRKRRVQWAAALNEANDELCQFIQDAAFQNVVPAVNARVCTHGHPGDTEIEGVLEQSGE